MSDDLDTRSLRAMKAYVEGDSAEINVFSDLKGIPRNDIHRVLTEHRAELEKIDPARSLILESLL